LGGPKNRQRGDLPVETANQRAAWILHEIGEYAARQGCFIALEALPAPECDFITNLQECIAMVRLVDTLGVRLHFDSGAADVSDGAAADGWLSAIIQQAQHCHLNDFCALPPGSKTPENHRRWARLLSAAEYAGALSIEMRCTSTPEESVRHAIRFVRSTYVAQSTD
jgi:sugar phosphate isomerase/epimerase